MDSAPDEVSLLDKLRPIGKAISDAFAAKDDGLAITTALQILTLETECENPGAKSIILGFAKKWKAVEPNVGILIYAVANRKPEPALQTQLEEKLQAARKKAEKPAGAGEIHRTLRNERSQFAKNGVGARY